MSGLASKTFLSLAEFYFDAFSFARDSTSIFSQFFAKTESVRLDQGEKVPSAISSTTVTDNAARIPFSPIEPDAICGGW